MKSGALPTARRAEALDMPPLVLLSAALDFLVLVLVSIVGRLAVSAMWLQRSTAF